MTDPPVYEVFFTGRDDPRDGCIVIGEDTQPIFYRFETLPSYTGNPRTTVSSDCSFSSLTTVDLIYPLLDITLAPHSLTHSPTRALRYKGLSECRGDCRVYGLDERWLSTRTAHDRQPSITYDPVCDAWIDRQVRPHFRLFGLHYPRAHPQPLSCNP
jgi:hypothetical protein